MSQVHRHDAKPQTPRVRCNNLSTTISRLEFPDPLQSRLSEDTNPPCPFLEEIAITGVPTIILLSLLKHLRYLKLRKFSHHFYRDYVTETQTVVHKFIASLPQYLDPQRLENFHMTCNEELPLEPFVIPLLKSTRLRELTKKCKNLRFWGLAIDASQADNRRAIFTIPDMTTGIQNWSLRMLDTGDSPISHKQLVATSLASIFPALDDGNKQHEKPGLPIPRIGEPYLDLDEPFGYRKQRMTSRKHAEIVEERDGDWSDVEYLHYSFQRHP
ncbi:hypothetical protein NP233_g2384 [Leucocoprinus birnbaumii]|uniref:Uncharacterized protein n=1 Tax=Leucocoprinus birnbaumii TaxID=56174 RepID=A0AAD5W0E3_9AGAR|nr:hypothetical protein NP233_g2384 [Leucocoprinus birnbaumii]